MFGKIYIDINLAIVDVSENEIEMFVESFQIPVN